MEQDVTEEQKAEVGKALRKARTGVFIAMLKFGVGIMVAQSACAFLCGIYLKEISTEGQQWFQAVCTLVNAIFMSRYLSGQLKANSATLTDKIKEILKK